MLDPFSGSGTTAAAAIKADRQYISRLTYANRKPSLHGDVSTKQISTRRVVLVDRPIMQSNKDLLTLLLGV